MGRCTAFVGRKTRRRKEQESRNDVRVANTLSRLCVRALISSGELVPFKARDGGAPLVVIMMTGVCLRRFLLGFS